MIEVRDVHKAFGTQKVLRGATLTIAKGEAVVIIGRSGGGKSVLLKHLIGLLPPDRGSVLVVNFWYASCPPCRAEAPDLAELATVYADQGVRFLGVNVYDNASGAQSFEKTFDIPYPSALDADSGALRLAFAGDLPPSGIPTTFIVDRDGRIAARLLGYIYDRSMFEDMLDRVVAEATP
jgi:energy-coupling factor transporter ATP-binding protein EcfA2